MIIMKSDKRILIAFLLNMFFSAFELIGGLFTNSVAIISDAFHDMGDALSIGISFFLEKKSRHLPDAKYTFGYGRYSVIGSVVTTIILLVGSAGVMIGAIDRIINPVSINYNGVIIFAVVGLVVNIIAAFVTSNGESLNQKAINLHMLEDVLGWLVVLVGSIIMRFTDISIIDPIMSIAVALFIFITALRNLKEVLDLFLEKTPRDIDPIALVNEIKDIEGIQDIHHLHIRSIDGYNNSATMHVVTENEISEIKAAIKNLLKEHNIIHSTLEFELPDEGCDDYDCNLEHPGNIFHQHHHHGHQHNHFDEHDDEHH